MAQRKFIIDGGFQSTDDSIIEANLSMTGNILPTVDSDGTTGYDLGSPTAKWRDLYLSSGSLYIDGQKVMESDAGTIVVQADPDQSLTTKVTGTGVLTFQAPTVISMAGTLQMAAGKKITDQSGTAVGFGDKIDMDSNQIINVGAPTADAHAATKLYVDQLVGTIATDAITEGDSEIEIADLGTGTVGITVDGVQRFALSSTSLAMTVPVTVNGVTLANTTYVDTAEADAITSANAYTDARETAITSYVDTQVAAANSGATADFASVTTALNTEISDRTSADTTLQSNIDVEKGRIDAILSAADADKDTFAEIVTFINSVDTTNDTALGTEITTRAAADTTLQGNIDSEASTRAAADTALSGRLDVIEGADSVEGSVAKAEADAKAYTDTRETAITTAYQTYADTAEVDAKAYTDTRETAITTAYQSYADQAEVDAKAYTDTRETAITTAYQAYADQAEADAETAAAAYTDAREVAITSAYQTYADTAEVDAKAYTDARETAITADYQAYADQAEADAETAAAAYTDAREVAITTAYQAYADQSEADAETAAAAYTDAREVAITTAYQAYADQAEVDAKAYADTKISEVVDAAPGTLDTLNELAAALGDDANFSTTITNSLATKATITYVDNEIATVSGNVTASAGDITTLQGDMTTAQSDISTLQTNVATNTSDIATNETAIAQNAADIVTAISTASTDATTKADAAQAAAESYTDGEISTATTSITAAYQSYADQAEVDAKAYADVREVAITSAYQSYADNSETQAKSYADGIVATEASTRSSADTTLQNNIDTEASTRASADTTLQNNIDTKAALSTNMVAGNGLTGGGTLASNRTFAVGSGWGISVSADAVAVNQSTLDARYVQPADLVNFHSSVTSITSTQSATNLNGTLAITFGDLSGAVHYNIYLNRFLLRPSEYSVSGTTVTFNQALLATDDELEVVGLKLV